YDLILLDVSMPDLNGFEVCKIIKQNPATSDIPVIFVSAKGEVIDKIEGLNLGAQDYISKPFNLDELKARINAVLRMKFSQDEVKEKALHFEGLSVNDELTGLYNHRYIKERLVEEVARASRYKSSLSCMIIDIDQFKQINETKGPLQGDLALKELARILKRTIRLIDIAGRYGGGEFVVIFPQTDLNGAEMAAERIRRVIENHKFKGLEDFKITSSVGVATYVEGRYEDPQTIFSLADNALFKAKETGRNKVVTYLNV
ncbi:MAG: diguanylate cyclase, partial [Armatimonadetes bacterium]|nr:diguanylate cyclase [Armatimonadota bacterium]